MAKHSNNPNYYYYKYNKKLNWTNRGHDTKGLFYRFYEVGTRYRNKGVSNENKLYLDNGMLHGKPTQRNTML